MGQQGSLTRIWAEKGTRPRNIRQQQFEYAYIYGAVCPKNDDAVGLLLPVANSEAMNLHLNEISERTPSGKHAVVIMDQAGWHKSKELKSFDNLTPIFLPPYSPELNPVEQVWQWLRDNFLANRCFDGYQDILDACTNAWLSFLKVCGRAKKLCSRSWALLGT